MRAIAVIALMAQLAQTAPLATIRASLRSLGDHLDQHKTTFGATADETQAKHALRAWVEAQLSAAGPRVDPRAFAASLHTALRDASLLCDDCSVNVLGYLDDVRVTRSGDFLIVVTAIGLSCGYDESAYVYAPDGGRWRRVWEHEENVDGATYQPQAIHDVQISAADAAGNRILLELGSQTICGGAFKDLYAKAWRVDSSSRSTKVLDWSAYANDGYPPLVGRATADDVLIEYTADGFADGDSHIAVRHFALGDGEARQIDPIAIRPHDFVLEWLDAPWTESRAKSAATATLESAHAQLRRTDHAGDFPEPTLRCSDDDDVWQVATRLYQGQKRYYRVRWRKPFQFTLVDVSDKPFAGCTIVDDRGDAYSRLFE